MTDRNYCCFLDGDGRSCSKPVRYWVGKDGLDDYTHSCAEHLQNLRRDGDETFEMKEES